MTTSPTARSVICRREDMSQPSGQSTARSPRNHSLSGARGVSAIIVTEADVARIAFLGTGLLGSGMVRHVLNVGTPVTVWNRTETKARALAVDGAKVSASPADRVAGADHIHLLLPDDGALRGLLAPIAPALQPGAS